MEVCPSAQEELLAVVQWRADGMGSSSEENLESWAGSTWSMSQPWQQSQAAAISLVREGLELEGEAGGLGFIQPA